MKILEVPLTDVRYPKLLRQIFDPPAVLYFCGDLGVLEAPCLAVVGTRCSSSYGDHIAFSFSEQLVKLGVTIVSGLAYGIDAQAHKGALKVKGKTVAVLAQPLDEIQPSAHRGLAEEIVRGGGLLLSEYASVVQTFKSDYLVRNRLIAGLCKATLVVEAGYRSGALNTAHYALEMGREVRCVPGRIGDVGSAGCLKSIYKSEAGIVTCVQDVLEALDLPVEKASRRLKSMALKGFHAEIVMELSKRPAPLSQLAEKYSDRLPELYASLSELELQGILCLTPKQCYSVGGG